VVSARDGAARPWITLLSGGDGFMTSPDPQHLVIRAAPAPGDALESAFSPGADVGILGIELATRRRNRANGRVAANGRDGLSIRIDQTFGNCPQYIREREWRRVTDEFTPIARRDECLSGSQRNWIESADTFFIASGYRGKGDNPAFGMDASHRGGARGFVEVRGERQLRFPDYAGNNHYNTMGNLVLDPRAGLLFIDFESGSLLQLSGTTSIDWDSAELDAFPGARRLVSFDIEAVVEVSNAVALRWQTDAESVRSLRLIEKIRESEDVVSFIFAARDGGALTSFEPGQHLPIEVSPSSLGKPISRTYSLSSSPADEHYRISVKREPKGLVSRHLHDHTEPGAIIECRRPAGDFIMSCAECPLVLVSAGVGLTPMVSMLRSLAMQRSERPVWFVHGARDGAHLPLGGEVRALTGAMANFVCHFAFSRPRPHDQLGLHYDSIGRIGGPLLASLVDRTDAHYFLCGPIGFMSDLRAGLEERGVPAEQIHVETFGPSG
jgi:ferredoxin-NADP reductase/predicted pyridoxine 5'-phosphate oxidase superfamily flavin-nucleotide-binding protein